MNAQDQHKPLSPSITSVFGDLNGMLDWQNAQRFDLKRMRSGK